jgi:uncharacterized protein YbjT (DUF2867 family)
MRVLVLGASQGTGALCVRNALDRGHEVTAFARSPQKLAIEHAHLKKLQGDFLQAPSVEAAVPGHDAVIITASASSLRAFRDNPRYFSQGTGYAIDAMKKAGVKRLAILSALGTGPSRTLLNPVLRLLVVDLILKATFVDHDRQEQLVRQSGLEWVIARPGRLTDGPAQHRYKKTAAIEPVPSSIARADVADFLVEACATPAWVGQAVQIGG